MRFGPVLALACLAFLSVAAKADTTNPVSGSGGGFSGTGTLYSTDNGNGSYTITGITGTGVTGLIAPGGFNGNDNLLFPNSTPTLDAHGFGFTDNMGDTNFQVDLYANAQSGYNAYILDSDGVQMDIPVTFSLAPASTPSAMFATAFVAPRLAPATTAFNFSYSATGTKSTPAPTPEPSSLALMGTGLVGLASILRHRRKCC